MYDLAVRGEQMGREGKVGRGLVMANRYEGRERYETTRVTDRYKGRKSRKGKAGMRVGKAMTEE